MIDFEEFLNGLWTLEKTNDPKALSKLVKKQKEVFKFTTEKGGKKKKLLTIFVFFLTIQTKL